MCISWSRNTYKTVPHYMRYLDCMTAVMYFLKIAVLVKFQFKKLRSFFKNCHFHLLL